MLQSEKKGKGGMERANAKGGCSSAETVCCVAACAAEAAAALQMEH